MDTDLDRLAADWIALWESETAARAQDRELVEGWSAAMALMAAAVRAQAAQFSLLAKMVAPHEPQRPAPAAAAPDAGGGAQPGGDDDATLMRARLAELERRLADLESGRGIADRPGAGRGRDRA